MPVSSRTPSFGTSGVRLQAAHLTQISEWRQSQRTFRQLPTHTQSFPAAALNVWFP